MSHKPGNETKSKGGEKETISPTFFPEKTLPVFLGCSYEENNVGDDEGGVAEDLPHHVPGVVRHPVAQRLVIRLRGGGRSSSQI